MKRKAENVLPLVKEKRKKPVKFGLKPCSSQLKACSSSSSNQQLPPVINSPRQQVETRTSYSDKGCSTDSRDWLQLPREIVILIFQKLGIVEMILTAQPVCSLWRDITKDPILFRHIHLAPLEPVVYDPVEPEYSFCGVDAVKFTRFAVARSCGQMVSFSCDVMDPFLKHHLHYVADSTTSCMKSLRMGYCPVVPLLELVQVVKKIPSLEELHMHDVQFPKGTIDEIGRCCTKLKHLQLETEARDCDPPSDQEAFYIAETMPNLRRLHLLKNMLTNIGFQAIIDQCRHLEYVFLSRCHHIDLEAEFFKEHNSRIQSIRVLSTNPQKEYEFHLQ